MRSGYGACAEECAQVASNGYEGFALS